MENKEIPLWKTINKVEMTPEKYTKLTTLNGESFKLKMHSTWFKNDIVGIDNGTKPMYFKVTKIYKFNWWKRFLFKLGFSFKSMEMKQIERVKREYDEVTINISKNE